MSDNTISIRYAVSLGIGAVGALISSIGYYETSKLLALFLKSLENGINRNDIDESKPVIGLVQGKVTATGTTLKSINSPTITGVIQKLVVKEHFKHRGVTGLWFSHEETIEEKCNVVPFSLKQGKYEIRVTSPVNPVEPYLEVIDDQFEPSSFNVAAHLIGHLTGTHRQGFQHTEYMLKENTTLTGFGEIVRDKAGILWLVPPSNGVKYILSSMDPLSMAQDIGYRKKIWGFSALLFDIALIIVTGMLVRKWWKARQERKMAIRRQRQIRQYREQRPSITDDESLKCVICMTQRLEVVLLPCGHVCLCAECTLRLNTSSCPVCRQEYNDWYFIFIASST